MEEVRAYLRTRTRAAHDRVDAVMGGFDLTEPAPYAAFLTAHAEALAEAVPMPPPLGLPDLKLAALAAADARDLGAEPARPAPRDWPSEAEAVGAYYVVTGSRLGGRLLEAEWRKAEDPCVRAAGRYLADRGHDVAWKALCAALPSLSGEREAVLRGAEAAFAIFERAGRAARRQA